jgi:glutamate---cysteine ligase / carboxylate-amine ligase
VPGDWAAMALSSRMALPAWAQWNHTAAERPWSVGIEEELMLLDPRDWTLANRIDDVLAELAPDLLEQADAETHACVLEVHTAPHATVGSAAAELSGLRRRLARGIETRLSLRAAAAGTHPLATRSQVAVTAASRYRLIESTMRALARREPTLALHVHVGIPDAETAVRALDGLRAELPLLLALSANSPYWRGSDSGFASVRTPIFSMFPRVGIPGHFGSYANYVRAIEPLVRAGAIPGPGFLWWDARLQSRLGTLEVRIMDVQSRPEDTAALAALVQCLVHRYAIGSQRAAGAAEVLAENRFLASRDGMHAELIDPRSERAGPIRERLARVLEACAPTADELGCASELAGAAALAEDPGERRQRRHAAEHGLASLPAHLAAEFTGARLAAA